jgi:hypothetical protein
MQRSLRAVFVFFLMAVFLQACTLPSTATPSVPLNLYISTTGNDTHDCLSPAGACLTLYQAWFRSTPGSTIHIGPGTYRWADPPIAPRFALNLQGAGVNQTTLARSAGDVIQFAYPARVDIRDLTILGDNPSTGGGNGIEIRAGVVLSLSNCHIHGKYWGLRLLSGATATVNNCTFDGNSYGVENFGNLTLSASTFTTNQVAMDNQGIANAQRTVFDHNGDFDPASRAGAPTITNSQNGQLTLTGGSISNSGSFGLFLVNGTALLDSIDIHNNSGMAVMEYQGSMEVRSSVIQDNGSYGLDVGGTLNIHETAILRNGSAGVRIDGGTVLMQNVTVSGNRANSIGEGGGIWMDGGGLFLVNSTVAFNAGIGITATPGVVPAAISARRTVVALNTPGQCMIDARVHTSYDSPPFMCVETFTSATLGMGPLTAAAGTFVHPLLAGSPLIDAGRPIGICPAVDQRGYARPYGPACDIGAYEFGAGAHLTAATPEAATPTAPILQIITDTPSPSAPVVPMLTFTENANCRKGPGTAYDVATSFVKGKLLPAVGRNEAGGWWLVQIEPGSACWVADAAVSKSGAVEQLPIVAAPPLPEAPSKLVNANVCDLKAMTLTVNLNWASVSGATWFNLYRNGSSLTSVGGGATSYVDNAPMGVDLTYAVEAVNAYGHSDEVTTTLPACK